MIVSVIIIKYSSMKSNNELFTISESLCIEIWSFSWSRLFWRKSTITTNDCWMHRIKTSHYLFVRTYSNVLWDCFVFMSSKNVWSMRQTMKFWNWSTCILIDVSRSLHGIIRNLTNMSILTSMLTRTWKTKHQFRILYYWYRILE